MNLFNNKGYVSYKTFNFLKDKFGQNRKKANDYLGLIADCIRYNTLVSVARAGTGHLGASLSIVELLTEIYFRSFNFSPEIQRIKDRDIFILSKGHGVPALYSTLSARGFFPIEKLDQLRRLKGLPGHCDISTPGVEANTGSLAMGLSKAVGYALFKRRFGYEGDVIVVTGDGELQEGQCWEALLSAASYKLDNLYIIIDDNKVQTDQLTRKIVNYGELVKVFNDLGLYALKADGTRIEAINKAFINAKTIKDRAKLLLFDTIKGQGVSFMEHVNVLKNESCRYIWHNKAPNKEQLETALNEILKRQKKLLNQLKFQVNLADSLADIPLTPIQVDIKGDNIIWGFAQGLLAQAKKNKKIIVFDCDLEEDCGFVPFHKKFPKRFFEMGIMEQQMVSTASAFSRKGYIPVISSYAAFLTSRANEQLYNFASEGGKALIVSNMAGVIPATPGKSHQGFRDIACMKNIPGILMYQPVTAADIQNILSRYYRQELGKMLYCRLSMAASRVVLPTPALHLDVGKSHIIKKGKDILIVGIGPVVLGEAVAAAGELAKKGISIEVWNHPWITQFDNKQYQNAAYRNIPLIIIEDHYLKGGFGESLLSFFSLNNINFKKIVHLGIKDFPETGFRDEVLEKCAISKNDIISTVIDVLNKF